MKVGTDAVLLGAWTQTGNETTILDIGTGSGVIALMLAQKCSASIDAIDIDENAFRQAHENFLISPWYFRLNCLHQSFQDFSVKHSGKYDLIVTNPPYFLQASKPSVESRTNARHRGKRNGPQLAFIHVHRTRWRNGERGGFSSGKPSVGCVMRRTR